MDDLKSRNILGTLSGTICGGGTSQKATVLECRSNVIRLRSGKLLVNLLQAVKRTNIPLIP